LHPFPVFPCSCCFNPPFPTLHLLIFMATCDVTLFLEKTFSSFSHVPRPFSALHHLKSLLANIPRECWESRPRNLRKNT
jgi:hypothetical protein